MSSPQHYSASEQVDAPFAPRWTANDLIPCIVQDAADNAILMMAWMNREALDRTLESGVVHFYSRSREALWMKGETSGNVLKLVELRTDCDQDTLLVRVQPAGPSCHTGERSCFYRRVTDGKLGSAST